MTGLVERIAAKVIVRDEGYLSPCWLWQGHVCDKGYAKINVGGKTTRCHRTSYEAHIGQIPDGAVLDHLCRKRHCVNPAHLEPVTTRVNTNRGLTADVARRRMLDKTHCPKGHEYSADNLMKNSSGWRQCRTCNREDCARRRAASRAPEAA